jgi:DNA (cytosine-5)-methyltransferase 1
MKFIDLFAGIGGFRSALTYLGGKCVYTNEWDKFAAQTYQAWYSDEDISTEDIRQVKLQASQKNNLSAGSMVSMMRHKAIYSLQ